MEEDKSYSKSYYKQNREKILNLQRERRLDPAFRRQMRLYYKEYYQKNKCRILGQSKIRRAKTKYKKTAAPPGISIRRGEFTVTFD